MKEIIVTPGPHIAYETTAKSIIFGDEDLSINLKNREMDDPVLVEVFSDRNGMLTMGTTDGQRYVAQVEIPARQYIEEEVEAEGMDAEGGKQTTTKRTPVPFDIDNCTISLWGLEE